MLIGDVLEKMGTTLCVVFFPYTNQIAFPRILVSFVSLNHMRTVFDFALFLMVVFYSVLFYPFFNSPSR